VLTVMGGLQPVSRPALACESDLLARQNPQRRMGVSKALSYPTGAAGHHTDLGGAERPGHRKWAPGWSMTSNHLANPFLAGLSPANSPCPCWTTKSGALFL